MEPVEAMDFVHRGHDGWVTYHRKDGKGFHNVTALRARDIGDQFPELANELMEDAYYSINGFWKPRRKGNLVQWLTCCFTDLDCYNVGRTENQTIAAVLDAQDAGIIPPASIIGRSGRGVWLFWVIYDNATLVPGPVRAWPENVETWRLVQQAIHRRLAYIGADAQSKDVARVTRVPGSMHSVTKLRVTYLLSLDANRKTFTYTLSELCGHLGVKPIYTPKRMRDRSQPLTVEQVRLSERAHSGWTAMHEKRLRQFQNLWSLRGSFRQGCRNHAALLYGHSLRCNGFTDPDISRLMHAFGEQCDPPLESWECEAAIKQARRRYSFTDQKIADWLTITVDEAAQLESWPPSVRFTLVEPPPLHVPNRAERGARRRDFIRQYVLETGVIPSLRGMAVALEIEGLHAATGTIAEDYKALGYNQRTTAPSTQNSLFESENGGVQFLSI